MPVNNTIKLRRGTDWSSNPVLSQGEPGFDTTNNILKIGDGTTAWSGLNPIGSGLDYLQSHPNISAASSSNNSGRTYIQDILLDNNGHVIGITTATESGAVTETNDLSSSVTWVNVPDANITESSVIQHSGALRLTESQIVDLQNYLTSFTETNDLSSAVTWANVPDTNITESSVVQHTGALRITESQIVDLQNYLTASSLASDTTPQLGGNLDLNSQNITGVGNIDITGTGIFSKIGVGTVNPAPAGGDTSIHIAATNYPELKLTNDTTGHGANSGTAIQVVNNSFVVTNRQKSSSIIFNAFDSAGVSKQRLNLSPAASVFNEDGESVDFRVEGNSDPNLLFLDASTDRVGIGTDAPSRSLHHVGDTAYIASDSSYALDISASAATLGGNRFQLLGTETVFNQAGENYDFRIAGDSQTNLFYVDASTDRVGIGTPDPLTTLHVSGTTSEGTILSQTALDTSWAGLLIRSQDNVNVASFQYGNSGVTHTPSLDNTLIIGSRQSGVPVKFYQGKEIVGAFRHNNERIIFDVDGNTTLTAASGQNVAVSGGNDFVVYGTGTHPLIYTDPDSGTGRVGIGISDPARKLHVVGDVEISGTIFQSGSVFQGGGGGISNVVEDTTPQLGGNLDLNSQDLIGAGDIDISGNIHASGNFRTAHSSSAHYLSISDDGGVKRIASPNSDMRLVGGGSQDTRANIQLTNADGIKIEGGSSSARNITINTRHVDANIIVPTGNLGLGTTSPARKLHVVGDIEISGTIFQSGSVFEGGGGGGGISNIVEDTTPQLGGNLDVNGKDIIGSGDISTTGHIILQETMPNHCGIQIKSSGDVDGELHIGSCGDANGVPNAMGLRHSSMDGGNDFMICANTDGATFVSAKDLKTLELTAGGRDAGVKLQLNEAYGFKFNENKQVDVDLQYQGDNDTNLFFIDASADSVGIGTNSPQTKLDVSGVITASGFKTQYGTSSQFLKADGSVDTNTYSTTDTQLTEEQVEDFVGGMVTGNTETGITVTYDDSDGTLDFVVASQTDENFTTADHSKLDGIEAGADVTDTANVTSAGALMDSELTDLAGVKGVTISTLQVKPSEGAFADGDKTKLDAIEASADVTDTTNVTAAGALMDSEVTNLSQVKAFDSSDYATAAQGTKADTAQQPPSEGAFANGDKTKLDGIEASADVTDATNVDAAGAVMNSDTSTASMSFVVDEDNMSSDSNTKVPTQQSVKAYIDSAGYLTAHPNISAASSSDNSGNTFIQDITLDSNGHVTALTTATASAGGGGGIGNVVEDTTPQLGGNLDLNSKDITGTGDIDVTGSGHFSGKVEADSFVKDGGTSSQFLKADGSVDTNTYSTTDTQLTEEQVEDFVGGMLTGNTETGITVTYQDADGTIDFVVASQTDENFTTADHSKLDGIEASADVTDTANVTSAGALMDSEVTNLSQVKAFDSSDYATAAQGTKADSAQQPPSEGAFANGDKTKLDGIETGATADQTDEEIQDIVGAMLSSNTETGITVTYQDADGTIDFVVASQTDENFTTADHSKLDGIEASADVTDTANVTSAGALMDSELASIADVKALDQSVVAGASPNFVTTNMTDASDKRFMTDAQETKLDSVESSADVTDTANVTAAGALMDSELTDLAGVKGVTISTLQSKPSEGAFANGDKTKLDGIEANATADQTDEEIQDIVGAMVSSNTETGITVTYQDADGTLDFVVDHDAASNFVANEHIDHTSVTLTAGDGLTGGGDISANRTFAVSVDDSTIEINSDALRIKDGAITSAKIGAGGFVFNEAGADADFRVEGDTDQNLLFVDGSTDKIGISTNTPATLFHIRKDSTYNSENTHAIKISDGNDPETHGMLLGVDSTNDISVIQSMDPGTSWSRNLAMQAMGGNVGIGTISPTAKLNVEGGVIFNDTGANVDFRVEGDADTDLLFVDASADTVQIGKLNINGAFTLPTADGSANQILKTDGNGAVSWAADGGGGGGGSMTTVKGNGSQVGGADIVTLDFASNFAVTETPDTEVNIDLSSSIATQGITATTGLIVGVSGLHHQSGTIVHSTEAAWGDFPGNAQNSINLLTGKTTNATFTSLEMNNGMYSGVKLPSNKTFMADVNIVGRRTNTGATAGGRQHAAYQIKACIVNDAFGTALVGSASKTVIAESNSAWDVQLAFAGAQSGQTDYLLVQCKGAASTNVNWVAKVDLLEVGGLNETSAYREANILSNMSPEIIP